MDTEREKQINSLTEKIIGAAFKVSNTLGSGFLEKVYENASAYEIRNIGFRVRQQEPLKVYYDNFIVGDYVADLMVEGLVLVELKAVKSLDDIHLSQCLNYLKATRLKLCLLLNFGTKKIQIKRIIN